MPCLSGFAGRTDSSPETAAEAFTTRPVFRREPPAGNTHVQKTDSARKRAKRKTAVAGGGLRGRSSGCSGFYCQGGEGCIFSVREDCKLGKLPCCFLPEHGLRPGWTAVADGGPGVSVFGSGSFHEAGLSKAFCLVLSKLCAITLRAVLSGRNREGAGALLPGCVFLSSIQTLSGNLYKKHTEISRIQ